MSNFYCLIDCDPIKYAGAAICEKYNKDEDILRVQPFIYAQYFINSMIKKCIKRCDARLYRCFLTPLHDKTNFRFKIYPEYKANRIGKRKPFYVDRAHQHILHRWKAELSNKQEADDSMSIFHCALHELGFNENNYNSVLCSIDKDFDNIPGWHFNPVKDSFYFVSEIQALRNFYLQILTGDTSDNVPRVKKGWRQKKAEENIQKALTEKELHAIVLKEVIEIEDKTDFPWVDRETFANQFIKRNGQLVWLRRKENEMWEPNI